MTSNKNKISPLMFSVTDNEVDRMLLALAEEHDEDLDMQDEIKQLSRSWVTAVMSQLYSKGKNKKQPQRRPFEYSKKKILCVLEWRRKYGLLRSDLPKRMIVDGDPINGKYAKEFSMGCFYWYGTDSDGTPNLWYRMELMNWDHVDLERGLEYNGLILQSAFDAMPTNIHQLNFILLLDHFNPVHAVKNPRLGPSFLKLFMKSCPDRLKRAVMVTGFAGGLLHNIAKALAPQSLMDKITVMRDRNDAANALIRMGLVSAYPAGDGIDSEDKQQDGLPTFLGGEEKHVEEVTTNLSRMISTVQSKMKMVMSEAESQLSDSIESFSQ